MCTSDPKVVDLIMKTCCALHNWLIDVDLLDQEWCSDPSNAQFYAEDWRAITGVRLEEIATRAQLRLFESMDLSRVCRRIRSVSVYAPDDSLDGCSKSDVLKHTALRAKLITHFTLKWFRNQIEWM
jgi:hypothetical protein